jgi:hypothetical protein
MAKVPGTGLKVEISTDTGTTWKELICELSNTLNFTRNTQTAPFTKCDTATAALEVTPTSSSWTVDFEALLSTSPLTTQVSYSDFLLVATNGTEFLMRTQYDNTGSDVYESGSVYITSFSRTAPADGFVGFSGTMTGSGALDITP